MSTLKIENAALKEAVRKCSVSEKDTITLFVTEKKSGDKNIAQLKTCNGNMQTSALVLVEIDTKGGETFIFPSALFSSSVSTLGTYADDDFELTIPENGGFLSISCGSASVDIPLLSEAISIEMADAKKEKYAYTKFASAALKEAFSIGSVAMDKECHQKAAANAVDVAPVSGNNGEKMLRICALNENCSMISVAYAPVLQEKGFTPVRATWRISVGVKAVYLSIRRANQRLKAAKNPFLGGSRRRRSRAHKAGESVRALKAEITTDTAIVTENCWNSRPVMPPIW